MSSEKTDGIYEKLLGIYARSYQKPAFVLNHQIDDLVKEGKTRDQAVLLLYKQAMEKEKLSNKADEAYKKLLSEYAEKGFTNPEGTLELTLFPFYLKKRA